MATGQRRKPLSLRAEARVTLKAAADGAAGKPKIHILAYSGGIMRPAGWGDTVINLDGLRLPPTVALLSSHQNFLDQVVGGGRPSVQNGQLLVGGNLTSVTEAGRNLIGLAGDEIPINASVGVEADETRFVKGGETIRVNGRSIIARPRGLTLVNSGELREVTIVPVGGDRDTAVRIAASAGLGAPFSDGDGAEAVRQIERERLRGIDDICSRDGGWGKRSDEVDRLRASAVSGDISIEDLQRGLLKALREGRADAPAAMIAGRDGSGLRSEALVLEASLAANLGLPEKMLAAHYDERTLDKAQGRAHRGATIRSCLDFVLRAAGQSANAARTDNEFIKAAFAADLTLRAAGEGGYSTYSLPGILGNVQNKLLLQAYSAVNVTWNLFCFAGSIKDFKPAARYRLTPIGQYSLVGPGGELKNVGLDEQKFANQLTSEGAILTLTRQDIINDDLGALQTAPKLLGRLSALAIEKAVYALLLANTGAFFSVGNKNYKTGGNSELGIDSLITAWQAMREQVDINKMPILLQPRVLLTPPALEMAARPIVRSQEVRESTRAPALAYPTGNPFEDTLISASSPWLAASVGVAGASDTGWYLFADVTDVAAMEVAFLNGQIAPTVETQQANFDTLGISFRAYHDFGVAFSDPRAAAFSAGA